MAHVEENKIGIKGLVFEEPPVFELGSPGRRAYSLPTSTIPEVELQTLLPPEELRDPIEHLPELSELDVVRHYTRLSQWNFSIDSAFYPLGSCTMKYNPKINEDMARLAGFAQNHPYTPEALSQGSLRLLHELQEFLQEVSGMDAVSLQPAAGAHGEMTGMLTIRAYHQAKGNQRSKVLMPDSAHGTNPASCTLCGYDVVHIPSNAEGLIDIDKLRKLMDEDTAAIMLTNPNTLGMFEKDILEITEIVHGKGGLVYCDGANLNALMGVSKVADMGVDVLHFNLHKTFSTPHGGGGPGAGPVGVKKILEPYLPVPRIVNNNGNFALDYDHPESVGKVRAFYGNFGILLRAYVYIRTLGPDGLRQACESAVLNANYIKARLKDTYFLPYPGPSLHECVFNDKHQLKQNVKTMDIAKALIDKGFHPPTVYFPLIVKGALMVEPTETESKETLDQFIQAMKEIAKQAENDAESFHDAPYLSKVSRPDEARAARHPKLRWKPAS
ncbi:aminomethyl-transferring glycine dehydrogenase subunit GcvPB [Nitrospina gracilis]|uniref:aminomethyl-transferring glycine dehydrogenase subunit GcvPB n=1 Tax=Nitrospina gracilis TaxID=35801 RepID=UPI001F019B7B|nr:aminomethyl-transferring glycine dehydrogenase subunit GcvPB [Nitrospina gracilis]MCF8720274.1 glycine dehydrogenase subunit 2 [Nitrospina gracilis Nb-211]